MQSKGPRHFGDSVIEACSYRGHSIDLDFQELLAGRVRCTYFIDASYCFQTELAANVHDVVRAEAVALAHASIDALDFQCPKPASEGTRSMDALGRPATARPPATPADREATHS